MQMLKVRALGLQDVDIHPTQRLLASGVIDGHLVLHDFTDGSLKQRHKVKVCVPPLPPMP
jgi:hypothetical protein